MLYVCTRNTRDVMTTQTITNDELYNLNYTHTIMTQHNRYKCSCYCNPIHCYNQRIYYD